MTPEQGWIDAAEATRRIRNAFEDGLQARLRATANQTADPYVRAQLSVIAEHLTSAIVEAMTPLVVELVVTKAQLEETKAARLEIADIGRNYVNKKSRSPGLALLAPARKE
jgi:hypothetical protein